MSAFGGKADIIEKRVNVRLMTQAEDDPNGQARSKTFLQALEQLATRRTARSATLSPPVCAEILIRFI
jgi:hypothetical protein